MVWAKALENEVFMRLLGWIVMLAALAFAGKAGHDLWQDLQQEEDQIALVGNAKPAEPVTDEVVERKPRNWPPIFGEPQPPKPVSDAPQEEPQPPKPPKPPIDSLGYALKGMVQMGSATWAMIDHPTGERLVRRGDELAEDIQVVKIDQAGVWVSRSGDEPELLEFVDQP